MLNALLETLASPGHSAGDVSDIEQALGQSIPQAPFARKPSQLKEIWQVYPGLPSGELT